MAVITREEEITLRSVVQSYDYMGVEQTTIPDVRERIAALKKEQDEVPWNPIAKVEVRKGLKGLEASKPYLHEVLDNMREVSEECEKSLAHISVDESIFDDAKEASITMFPLEVDGKMTLAVGGTTFPWGDKLKKEKFSFEHIVNGEPLNLWLRDEDTNADMDADDLQELFEEFGWTVNRYDGVEDNKDDDDK